MLFSADAWPGIADGTITVTFRSWKHGQAKLGGRYRVAGMLIEATDVRQVAVAEITADDARQAGAADLASLLSRLDGCDPVSRVDSVFVGADDRIARRNATSSDDLTAAVLRALD